MTDITELAQSHELLIANGQQTADLLRHLADNEIDSDYFAVVSECESYGKETDAELSITEFALRAAGYVDALVEALEKAQQLIDELQQGFIANQEEAHEAIKYATELKEQLARANAGREEAFSEVDEMQKSLDHTHRRRTIWRWRAFTAEAEIAALRQRIADLDSRTVKLPKPHAHLIWIQAGHAPDDYWDDVAVSRSEKDRCCDGSERYPVYARWEIEEMLTAAGIKVEAE